MKTFYYHFLILLLLLPLSQSGQILVWQPMSSKSQMIALKPLINELSRRNHSIINVAPSPMGIKDERVKTIETDADVEKILANMTHAMLKEGYWAMMREAIFNSSMDQVAREVTNLPDIQKLIKDKPHFDAIIVTVSSTDIGLYMARRLFKAPVILFSPGITPPIFHEAMGNPINPSFLPTDLVSFPPRMSFWQRLLNFLTYSIMDAMYRFVTFPVYANHCKEVFNLTSAPDLAELLHEADLLLINSHLVFEQTRPLNPNTVLVGGINIDREAKSEQLPKEIKKFVEGAEHGAVLLSLGSITRASSLPESTRSAIMNAISRMKQRFVWKWDGPELKNKPENLMLTKWVPQQPMLAHPNVRLFITHAGLLSTTEALYFGVPVVAIPGFGDQFANALRAERLGYGSVLYWSEFDEANFESTVQGVLTNISMTERVRYYGSILRDEQNSPLERAAFHVEYVMRHKGAKHLRPASLDLNWFQYLGIDVFALLLTPLMLLLLITWMTVKALRRCCRGGERVDPSSKAKKDN